MSFTSHFKFVNLQSCNTNNLTDGISNTEDADIRENRHFSYPVFIPETKQKFSKAIILLHGLNERSWVKYLPWAHRLAVDLQRPVILFPISFHMNRSPSAWSNPRLMSALLPGTRLLNHRNKTSTFSNLALSLRLSQQPLRFFTSGSQSIFDLENLISSIRKGKHSCFSEGTEINIFAYSIGAFLAQVMMLTYGNTLLSDSKLMMFCGGALFERMNGISKMIMDEEAFHRLRYYYLHEFEGELQNNKTISNWIEKLPGTRSFISMLHTDSHSLWRNEQFHSFKKRIQVVALKNDKVIPPAGIKEVFGSEQVELADFNVPYTHETPFPLNGNPDETNNMFEQIFSKAVKFLS